MISSLSNPQIKNLLLLKKKAKARKEQDVFLAEGLKMFEEAPKESLVKVYVSETCYTNQRNINKDYFEHTPIELLTDAVFNEISDTVTPQGILAVVKQRHTPLKSILDIPYLSVLLLENLRDPGNLGTIVRTAEGAGISGLILSRESVDIYNPKVIRSTMGSIYRMPFVYTDNLTAIAKQLKNEGISLFAAHLSGRKFYDEEDYTCKCGIMIGNEASGLSGELSGQADYLIRIPMEGNVESLNAAVAAAVLMYEIHRQRKIYE